MLSRTCVLATKLVAGTPCSQACVHHHACETLNARSPALPENHRTKLSSCSAAQYVPSTYYVRTPAATQLGKEPELTRKPYYAPRTHGHETMPPRPRALSSQVLTLCAASQRTTLRHGARRWPAMSHVCVLAGARERKKRPSRTWST